MKIQCNVCEKAEAVVLCCVDEAVLCVDCDHKVHAANKLARKHQRVPLTRASSSRFPNCDICQEAPGYFFCLEDRAILCMKCDIAVHSANSFVSAHQRFLLTGVKVGPETAEPPPPSSAAKQRIPAPDNPPPLSNSSRSLSVSLSRETAQVSKPEDSFGNRYLLTGGMTSSGNSLGWPLNEFFGFSDHEQDFGFTDYGNSKTDSGIFGSKEGSPTSRSSEELDNDNLGVLETQVMVPEISSPPTTTGMCWTTNPHYQLTEDSAFVPDISGLHQLHQCQHGLRTLKRRRLTQ